LTGCGRGGRRQNGEVDAYATHGDAATYEDDHILDADFEAAGIKLLRFTGRRIRARPQAVVARIAARVDLPSGRA